MKFILPLPLLLLVLLLSIPAVNAADQVSQASNNREAQLEADIELLKKQLAEANQQIEEKNTELRELRKSKQEAETARIAATSQALSPASSPASPPPGQMPTLSDTTQYRKSGLVLHTNPVITGSDTRLSQEQLLLGGVEDISRLEYLAPGLRFGETGHDIRLSMRGARTNSIGPEGTSVVGMFEDGIYIPTSTERTDNFLDVDYIDVLRGPQVTTFGQGAYAGAVSVVTNRPNFEGFDGYAIAENGLPDKTRWELAVNIPVTDTLAVRLAGLSETRSGWINNYVLESDADDLDDQKVQTMKVSILWQPSDRFNILVWSRYQDENGAGTAPWGYQQIGGYVNGSLQPGHQFAEPGYTPDIDAWNIFRNFDHAISFEHWVNTVELNWDMGFADLKWLSNFTSFHGRQIYDNDYTNEGPYIDSDFAGWNTSQISWSSELRLTSNSTGRFNWLAGLYAFDRAAEWGWLEVTDGVLAQPDWDTVGTYSATTVAAFGQASYEITDQLILSGGLRWNEDGKTTKTGQKGSWDDVLWKTALEYNVNDSLMTYVSASTGYLPGGINSVPGVNATWEPETLTAYELGLKGAFLDGRLNLDVALFYNDFNHVQSQSFLLQTPGPEATEYTGNGGPSSATGIEAEVRWLPMPQWNVSGFVTYTDAKFGNFVNNNLAGLGNIPGHTDGDNLNYNGWQPALTPDMVVGLQTFYDFHMNKYGTLTPYFQTTYSSEYYASDLNLEGVRQQAQSRTDVRIIWQTPVENFRLQFYYLNAETEQTLNWARVYNPRARPDITTLQANWGKPNAYGIIFDYVF